MKYSKLSVATCLLLCSVLALADGPGTNQSASASSPMSRQRTDLQALDVPALTVTPIFHQLVAFTLPAGFKTVGGFAGPNFYSREHVPDSESVKNWSRIINVTGAKSVVSDPKATLVGFLAEFSNGFRKRCPNTFAVLDLGDHYVSGYNGHSAVISCGSVLVDGQSRSETAIVLAVSGVADYYTFQWAEHGESSPQPLRLEGEYWEKKLAQLEPLRLCAIQAGEVPPYPSCSKDGSRPLPE
ncbi:MAG: hypothetical protein ABSE43_00725 [Steroidobacteraceae bacterium]